jgi:hypothetical protein
VNLLLLTVPFETTKIKPVKIVVRLGIASTTVQSNATSPPTSSVVSVEMLVIWLEIVQIDSVVQTGAMILPVPPLLRSVALVLETPLTENTR